MSAVVIKACALKGGQSIRLSACTSHQAAAKNESPGPGGLIGPLRARERATGGFAQESVITAAEDTAVLEVRAAVKLQRK